MVAGTLRRIVKFCLSLVTLGLVISGTLVGQGTLGTITGVVTDSSGAVIPAASIAVVSESTGANFRLLTNDAGIFYLTALLPGPYSVRV